MIALAAWTTFGPDIIGSVVGGLVAGVTAWFLLKMTQKDEAKIRATEAAERATDERKKAARALLVQVRNLRDLLCSDSLSTVRGAPTYGLRNQVAVSQFELAGQPIVERLEIFSDESRKFRAWIRAVPQSHIDDFKIPASSAYQQWQMSRAALGKYADALQLDLLAVGDGKAAPSRYPEIPALPPWP